MLTWYGKELQYEKPGALNVSAAKLPVLTLDNKIGILPAIKSCQSCNKLPYHVT